ncbi:hypothetical protein F5879DRAFT_735029 [Lentinula edodes]|nr:hypothetical protein F5879DRAFT_735029 [Lentinula edodes]
MDIGQDVSYDSTDDEKDQDRSQEEQELEEEEMYHQAAPSLDDHRIWKPFVPKSMAQEVLLPNFDNLHIDDPPRFSSSCDHIHYSTGRSQAVNIAANSNRLHSLQLTIELLRRSKGRAKRPFDSFRLVDADSLARLNRMRSPAPSTFKTSAGAINKIVQHKNYTFVASSVVGGYPDEPGETENSYNRPGTFIAWKDSEHHVLDGHSRQSPFPKHYTVNDVAICPTMQHGDDYDQTKDHIVVTTGNDYKLKMWQQSADGSYSQFPSSSRRGYKKTPGLQPIDIAVKPGGGMFAVSGRQVLLHSERLGWDSFELTLTLREGIRAGSLKWGCGLTDSLLFASSESCGDDSGVGYHKAFDASRRAESFQFDLDEDGDAMAVDDFGERVAFVTVKKNNDGMVENENQSDYQRTLRIYDVRRRDGRHQAEVTHQIELESSEVKCASFSPDGIYLAIGRLNGSTLLYDSRFMDEVLYDFAHDGSSLVSPGNESYGITHMEWRILHQNRLGLVTGGPDGCVRLWQPHWAPRITEQGRIIAQVNADVGYFAIGDRFQSEHELVVGDGDGAIYFFDGIGNI